ncbi:MAG: L-fucose:H+ symporter permease [Mucilaginibacter sp.]|uniref:sugar MFS transporter n=1 Tax=Mucilaginibacter sp. TaxID=1882438 RepID=UPI00262059F2|nr:sugar MFS transporter [Mucilaginibacter sp.]MDB5002563.1 L-fucose:H+ symporter permease [Mucilaginibacter sp.]
MQKNKYLIPLVLVTSLFFLWGFAYGLLDVLNKHFQETLNITKSRSTLLQGAYFGAYFLIALPAGIFMNKYGYKKGIIMGLLLYAAGAFLFYPAAQQSSFNFFLIALFILASGLTCLETAANPYVTVLGSPETSETRLNLSQCFNGVGSFLGPIIAAYLFFGGEKGSSNLDSVKMIYIIIGIVVLIIAALFIRTPLPEIKEDEIVSSTEQIKKPLFNHSNFTNGVIAQFFYVAAQVGIAALFINYCTEAGIGISNAKAAGLLSAGLILFTAGRFVGTALMRVVAPNKLLTIYAVINVLLCVLVIANKEWLSVYALLGVFFFESIMFPTIFALGVKDLGHHTKKGSSFIIMSIVGGALMPYAMGLLAEKYSTATSYSVPLICFIVVAWYGWKGYLVKGGDNSSVKVEFKH